jgi:hypothetical protein
MFSLFAAARRFWAARETVPAVRRAAFASAPDQPSSPTTASWILHAR